jgi:hypothetical protein
MPTNRSTGEALFEAYLRSQCLTDWEFEKSHSGKKKRPDYSLSVNGFEYLFDVKEFKQEIISGSIYYDPYTMIRDKIEDGREQFREYKDRPCSLVLYNEGSPFVHLSDPDKMFGAMLGDVGFSIPVNLATGVASDEGKWGYFDGGKMIRPKTNKAQNTTISALITLRYVFETGESHLGVIVWENPYARFPLPRDLFCGPYDERYTADPYRSGCARIFAGSQIKAFV